MSDPYEVLGVPPGATQDELRDAYRRRVKETHPDAGGDVKDFLQLQEAWKSVGSVRARAAYDAAVRQAREDQLRAALLNAAAPPRPRPTQPPPEVAVQYRIPVWFWFFFFPLAVVSVLIPGVQVISIPMIALLAFVAFLAGLKRNRRDKQGGCRRGSRG